MLLHGTLAVRAGQVTCERSRGIVASLDRSLSLRGQPEGRVEVLIYEHFTRVAPYGDGVGAVCRGTRAGVGVTFLAGPKGITLNGGGTLEVTDVTSGDLNIYPGIIAGTGQFEY